MTSDVVMVNNGGGALMCSLNLSPKVLSDSPVYSSSQSTLPHLYLQITPLFCSVLSLSLECTRRSLMVLPPLKYISTPCFLQMFLQAFTHALYVWYYYVGLFGTCIIVLVGPLFLLLLVLCDVDSVQCPHWVLTSS